MSVKKGDRVLIGKYSGQDIKINDEEHTILRETRFLAIIVKVREADHGRQARSSTPRRLGAIPGGRQQARQRSQR